MFAKIVAMNFHLQYQNKNSTPKKALRMNRVVARPAEEHVSSNVVALAQEKTARCLKQYVLPVIKRPPFRLNRLVEDLFIAGNVFKPDAVTNFQNENDQEDVYLWQPLFSLLNLPEVLYQINRQK